MRLLGHLLMIGDMEVSHTWPKRFQYVIFVSKYKQNALMEPLFHLNHGYACSSGRKLSMPGLRYTTLESLIFDSWYRQDSYLRHTQMSTIQQHFLGTSENLLHFWETTMCSFHWMTNIESKWVSQDFQ